MVGQQLAIGLHLTFTNFANEKILVKVFLKNLMKYLLGQSFHISWKLSQVHDPFSFLWGLSWFLNCRHLQAIRSWIGAVWSQNGRFLHRFPQLLTFKCVFQSQFNCPRNKIASNNPLSICRSCLWHKSVFYIVFLNVVGCSVVFMNKRGWLSFENLTLKSTSNSPFCGGGVCPDWLLTVVSTKSDPSSFCQKAAAA